MNKSTSRPLAAALLAAFSGSAIAEQPAQTTTTPPVTVWGKPEGEYTAPAAVTATKTDTPVFETPFAIITVPQQVLQDQGAILLEDATRNVSGVFSGFNNGSNNSNFIIRGFDIGSNIYVNGFRSYLYQMDPANVDRIEVLKGAAGSGLFGRIEPGGLINIVTKKPQPQAAYAAELTVGSYGFVRPVLDATGPVDADRTLLYRMIMAYQDNDSFRNFVGNRHVLVAPSLSWIPDAATQVNLTFEYKDFYDAIDYGIPAVNGRPANVSFRNFYGVSDAASQTTGYRLAVDGSHRFTDDWSAVARLGWWKLDRLYRDSAAIDVTATVPPSVNIYNSYPYPDDYDSWLAELNLNGKVRAAGMDHNLLLGVEWQTWTHDTTIPSSDSIGDPGILSPLDLFYPKNQSGASLPPINPLTYASFNQLRFNASDDWYAVFAQDQITVVPRLNVLLSGRYDWAKQSSSFCFVVAAYCGPTDFQNSSSNDGMFTPRVGATYEILPWLAAYASYAESFASNSVVPLASGGTSQPETAQQYEAGFKGRWFEDRLTSTLAFYQLTKQNLVVPSIQPGLYDQIGSARSRGIELDVGGRIGERWRVIASYAYTDAKITDDDRVEDDGSGNVVFSPGDTGKRLRGVPLNAGSVWAQYLIGNGWSAGGGVFAVGQRYVDDANTVSIPGYVRFDASASYSLMIGPSRVTAQVNLNNVFNTHYFDPQSSFTQTVNASPSMPRAIFFTLRAGL